MYSLLMKFYYSSKAVSQMLILNWFLFSRSYFGFLLLISFYNDDDDCRVIMPSLIMKLYLIYSSNGRFIKYSIKFISIFIPFLNINKQWTSCRTEKVSSNVRFCFVWSKSRLVIKRQLYSTLFMDLCQYVLNWQTNVDNSWFPGQTYRTCFTL